MTVAVNTGFIDANDVPKKIIELQTEVAATQGGLDGVVAGTVSASKAVIVDASSNIAGFGNVGFTGLLKESTAVAITAGTTRTQAGATALAKEVNRVDTSTAPSTGSSLGDGVALPASSASGQDVIVINNTNNFIQVYGTGADTINGVAAATGVAQMPNSVVLYVSAAAGTYFSEGLASGNSGSLQAFSAVTGIVAHAGGTQAGAQADSVAQLNALTNNVVTVGTAADSVALPAAKPGLTVVVRNGGVNSMQVFGAGTDTVNSIATATGVPQDPNTIVTYECLVSGNWISIPDAGKPGQFVTGTTTTTFAAGQLTGAGFVCYNNTQGTPGSITTRTATQMFNDAHNAQVGQTYMLLITNAQGTGTLTVLAGSGVTLTGTATIAINSGRLFAVKFTSATALTMTNVATVTFS